MILITAATGQIGRAATRRLVESGVPVRALVRDPARAGELSGAELVRGSYEDDASLALALTGVRAVLLAGRDNPGYVAQIGRVIEAAVRAQVEHVVALSAIGASASSPIALMRDHHEVEQLVRRSGRSWTILRPHLYMQNLLRAADAVRSARPPGRADGRPRVSVRRPPTTSALPQPWRSPLPPTTPARPTR